jgi:single-strand DNA-binding protein
MNTIYIAGNIGADPVTRFTPSGQKVTSFNVATNIKRGENTTTIWYRITVWGDRFDKMMAYLKKGSSIIVIGELQEPKIWTDKEGRPQVSLDVTAEILRFSPFGKADRPQEAGSSASRGSQHEEGFGEQTFGGGSQQGHKQHQDAEEDALPF